MPPLFCNTCNKENHPNSTKCEECKSIFNENNIPSDEEWENDFLYIENAELKGQVFKLEHLQDIDKSILGMETVSDQVSQAIKQEPEFQIEPECSLKEENPPKEQVTTTERYDYKCNECNKCFKRKASLLAHVNCVHCSSDPDEEYSDSTASESLPQLKTTSQNQKIQNISYLKKDESVKAPLQTGISKCDLCYEHFSNTEDLEGHRKTCETKEKFYCNVCKIFVSRKAALTKHLKSKQHVYNVNNPHAEKKLRFVCELCDEKFSLQIYLTKHKQIHQGDSRYETSRVEKIDGRTRYVCEICGKLSKDKSRHTIHHRVHTKEKPIKCDLCGSAFSKNSSLVIHMRLHSDERPFKCNICGETYRHQRNLREHLLKHTGQRPFKCKYCDKTFALKHTFNDHLRVQHTGETPYQCEECKGSFKTSYLLNAHRRQVHKIDTNSKPRVKILFSQRLTSSKNTEN